MTGMVLVDAGTYEQLTAHAAALKAREQSVLDLGNQEPVERDGHGAGGGALTLAQVCERQVADRLAYYANYL